MSDSECSRASGHRDVDGHVLCPYIRRETTEQWCHTHDQDYERCLA